MVPSPKKRTGVRPEWATLPKRCCDDCGTKYKPVKPLREGERGFCSATCRKAYHKHGGAYRKLRVEVVKLVAREVARQIIDEIMPLYNDLAARVLALEGSKPAALHTRLREAEGLIASIIASVPAKRLRPVRDLSKY